MALSKLLLLAALSAITVEVYGAVAPLTNSPDFEYVGCYAEPDGGGSALYGTKGPVADDTGMTIEECLNQCSDEGPPRYVYEYVGLEYSVQVCRELTI